MLLCHAVLKYTIINLLAQRNIIIVMLNNEFDYLIKLTFS